MHENSEFYSPDKRFLTEIDGKLVRQLMNDSSDLELHCKMLNMTIYRTHICVYAFYVSPHSVVELK